MLIFRYLNGEVPFCLNTDEGGIGGAEDTPTPDGTLGTPGGSDDFGTPADDQPGGDQHEVDWQERYNELQPEFTRKSQELAEYQRLQQAISGQAGPEAQAEALAAFGIELEDDQDETDEYDDDFSRLDRLEATIAAQQEMAEVQAAQQQEREFLTEAVEELEDHAGREFSDDEIAVLVSVARANPTQTGAPDMQLAYQHLNNLLKQQQQNWIKSKKAGRRPGAGIAAGEAVDLSDPDARVHLMAERLEALSEDEG